MRKIFLSPVKNIFVFLILGAAFFGTLGLIWFDSQDGLDQLADYFFEKKLAYFPKFPQITLPSLPSLPSAAKDVKKFVSEQDFKDYLQKGGAFLSGYGRGGDTIAIKELSPLAAPNAQTPGTAPGRVSETNVQVAGIDEPDIVKTDGQEIYFSLENYYYWRGGILPMMPDQGISFEEQVKIMPPQYQSQTKLIKAFPPADLKEDAKIDKAGNLLLSDGTLLVFSGQEILGYDVTNPAKPEQKWNLKLGDNVSLAASRLYQGKVYLVTQSYVNQIRPCPIEIMKVGETPLSIRCQDIYHPVEPLSVDSTFTVLLLDPQSGKVEKNVSFVGASGTSVVYLSAQGIYVTYPNPGDATSFFLGFLKEKAGDLFPAELVGKIERLSGYELSSQTKMMELQTILQNYQNSLESDARLKLENEMSNRLSAYLKEHRRELGKTGIVKVSLSDFSIQATGSVPGSLLNQFSLDEYQGNLRVAVTVGQNWWGWGIASTSTETTNDVYILGPDLKVLGSIKDLGTTERIYSARFVEDKGYLVTFRQTDPFYVLDLSNPRNPQLKGELKIPGFSSYLHPVPKDLILGVGQENWQVKLSLFDVSNPADPKEVAKYNLSEGWTEVSNNHHAFLMDTKHGVFFLPGGQGGYIFSYKNNNLEMKKAIADYSVKRAIYLDDYLYVIGENKITVLNELNWETVKELEI